MKSGRSIVVTYFIISDSSRTIGFLAAVSMIPEFKLFVFPVVKNPALNKRTCGPDLPLHCLQLHEIWQIDSQENHPQLLPADVIFYS